MDKYILLSRFNNSLTSMLENPNLGIGALNTTYSGDAVCQAHLESLSERSALIHKDLLKRIVNLKGCTQYSRFC